MRKEEQGGIREGGEMKTRREHGLTEREEKGEEERREDWCIETGRFVREREK